MKNFKFAETASGVVDVLALGFLWLICSIPVITLGVSSSALYQAVVKSVRHGRGSAVKVFLHALRTDFRQATLIWLIYAVYLIIGVLDIYAFQIMDVQAGKLLGMICWLFFLPPLLTGPWIFAYVSRFSNTVKNCFRYAAYLCMKNLPRTFMLVGIMAAVIFIGWLIPQVVLLLPGVTAFAMSFIIEPALRPLTENIENGEDQWYNE